MIVPVAVTPPSVALAGLLSVTMKVSASSSALSFCTVTLSVVEVLPAEMVTVALLTLV